MPGRRGCMDLTKVKNNWSFLSLRSKDHFKSATLLQHHAVQFIAMAGRYLIPQKKDDSNTQMKWYLDKKMVTGEWIDSYTYPLKLGIQLSDLILMLLDPTYTDIAHCNMQGRTKSEIFDWLKDKLDQMKVETLPLKMDLHYSIPFHKTEEGASFGVENHSEMLELTNLRNNAELVMQTFAMQFENASPVRIWPHHFDTSFTVPVKWDEKGQWVKTLTMGLAKPDEWIDYYYFYVNHWSADSSIDYNTITTLKGNGHWFTGDWIGAVLPLNELYQDSNTQEQVNRVCNFLHSAVNNTFDLLLASEMKLT